MDIKAVAKQIITILGETKVTAIEHTNSKVLLVLEGKQTAKKLGKKPFENLPEGIEVDGFGNRLQVEYKNGKEEVEIGAELAADFGSLLDLKPTVVTDAALRKEENKAKNDVWYKNGLKKVGNIFIPIVPAFIACGLTVAIWSMINLMVPTFAATPTGKIMHAVGYVIYSILPIIVGYNTSREFGGTPVVGAVLAGIFNTPALTGTKFLGITIVSGQGGVISVILIAYLATWVEKYLRKFIPKVLDLFLIPLITVLIMTVVGIILLGPLGGAISDAIGGFVSYIILHVPLLAGVASAVYLPLVMTGLHHGLIAVNTQFIQQYGFTYLLPVCAMAGGGQVGASVAVMLRTKNERIKNNCKSGIPVGLIGSGEALMWGVTVPLGKPFIASCLGGAVGGSVQALLGVGAKVPELSGIPLAFITTKFPIYFVGLIVSYIAGFVICNIMGWEDPED